jgi:exodeoxyribonuclease VII small subunit
MPKSKGGDAKSEVMSLGKEEERSVKAKDTVRATPDTAAPATFETSLRRLEIVVAQLEQGEQPLAQALALFEEGVKLSRRLTAILEEAQARLDQVLETRAGVSRLEPFGDIVEGG